MVKFMVAPQSKIVCSCLHRSDARSSERTTQEVWQSKYQCSRYYMYS